MIEMDTEGYVILPVSAEFSDASPQLEFVDTEDSSVIAALSYTYAGQTVGSTELRLTSDEMQEFNFQKTGEESEDAASPEGTSASSAGEKEERLVKINLRILGIAAGILLLILVIVLLAIRISKNYSFDLNFLRKWRSKKADWNSFSNSRRRRYKSRKRRGRNNRKFKF